MNLSISTFFSKAAILFLSIGTIVLSLQTETVEEVGEHPGYYEQFQVMKQNENGYYPTGMWKAWGQESRKMNKAQFFKNIKEIGPTNIAGRTRTILVDMNNSEHLITGGVSGGIWVSESGGANWTALDDDAINLAVTGLTQNPFNPDVYYYCTGEINNGTHVNWDGNGIFKSTNGGKSFSQIDSSVKYPGFNTTWDIEHSKTDSNTFYIATASYGLWRSTDGGMTYDQLFKSSTDINDIDAMKDGRIYFTKEGKGMYYFYETDELPEIVEVSHSALPSSGIGRTMVEPCLNSPNVVYAAFGSSNRESLVGIYKSIDTAKTWTKLSNRTDRSYNQIWHNFVLAVDPDDPDFVLMGGVTAEFSRDGGENWDRLLNTHSDYHDVAFVPGTDNFYTVSDGGVYLYNQATARSSATNGNTNLNITQLYAGFYFPEEDGDKVILGAQDNWTTVNSSGTSSFTKWLGGDGMWNGVSQDGNLIYGSSQNGNIRRRTNNTGWVNIYTPLASKVGTQSFWFANPFELNPVNGQNVFFPTKNVIARTTNAGSSWTVFTNTIPGNVFNVGITPETNPTVYCGGQSGLLYRIHNANTAQPGDEFKMFTLAPIEARAGFIGQIKVDPNDYTTIYTPYSNAGTNSRLWKIIKADTDEPQWIDISGNLPVGLPVNWIEIDPENSDHLMIATDFGVYVSVNGGQWWEKETRIPNVYVAMLRLRPSDRRLYIFTFGRGVWAADLEDEIFSSASKANLKADLNVYPNPAVNSVTISSSEAVSYRLFSLSGQVVSEGSINQSTIDVSAVSNGTYVLQTTSMEGAKSSTKLIVQH